MKWNGMDKKAEPGIALLQERICSLIGSKFFPIRVPSKINGKKVDASKGHSNPFSVLNYAGSVRVQSSVA